MLARSKRNSVSSTLEENRSDPQKFWRVINTNPGIGKKAATVSCTKVRSLTNEILQKEIVGRSKYHARNGTILAENVQNEWDSSKHMIESPDGEFHFDFILMNIVQKLVRGTIIHKSSGIENINAKLLKDAFRASYVELTYTFNESIRTGIFPRDWVMGNITPIPLG